MDNNIFKRGSESKTDLAPAAALCRCCLSTEKRMKSVTQYNAYFMDLIRIKVSESDGLPQWICWECCALLQKAVKFKHKMLRAHNLLYDYSNRCAPFPIHVQDPELPKMASSQLSTTQTLCIDSLKGNIGYSKALEHVKEIQRPELVVLVPLNLTNETAIKDGDIKDESSDDDMKMEIISDDGQNKTRVDDKKTEINVSDNEVDTKEDCRSSPCIFCGEEFPTKEQSKRHRCENEDANKKNFCAECNKSFKCARYLTQHYRRIHSRIMERQRKKETATHVQASTLLPKAVCEICGKKWTSIAKLVYHQRTHSGEKPYQCSQCPKRFGLHQRLKIHMQTHTGERPCKCPHCPKSFYQKSALNRHSRVHSGARPYSCPHCGKSFSQSNTLKGHVRTVHLRLPQLYGGRSARGRRKETGSVPSSHARDAASAAAAQGKARSAARTTS